jgi:D-alanyl-D-alanine carboxypeptidase
MQQRVVSLLLPNKVNHPTKSAFPGAFFIMKRIKIYSILCLLMLAGAWLIHIWITSPLQIPRWIYPAEASLVSWSTQCSESAPNWLRESARTLPSKSRSPANQLAYVDRQGNIHTCINGWTQGVLGGKRVSNETSFRIASLTKFFTALLIVAAHEKGMVSVDTVLSRTMPELGHTASNQASVDDAKWIEIKVSDLLRHSAGFDRTITPDPMFPANRPPSCPEDIAALRRIALDFEPGTRYSYGNLNYCLLGVIAERIYGSPYRTLVSQRFLQHYKGGFVDGPYSEDEPQYDTRFENFYTRDYWKRFDFYAFSAEGGLKTSARTLLQIVKEQGASLSISLAFANQYVLKSVNCSIFMQCYSLLGSYYDDGSNRANVWRGNLIGSASMLIVKEDGTALAWLGAGQSPTQYRDDEKMFRFWLQHM